MLSTGGRPEGTKRDVADLKGTAFPPSEDSPSSLYPFASKEEILFFQTESKHSQSSARMSVVGTVNEAMEPAGWKSSHLHHVAPAVIPTAFPETPPRWV